MLGDGKAANIHALVAGGQVQRAFAESARTKGFGMVTDRFGTPWMVNGELQGE